MPLHLITVAIFVFITYKWGDYKNWQSYYSTILFFSAGDLMYNFLFNNKILWQWKSPFLSDITIELLWMMVLFPCIILLYLPYFKHKKKLKATLFYILAWIVVFSALEWFFYYFNYIKYYNGWNFNYSVIFYSLMFPLLTLHHFKPLAAIILASVWAAATILFFHVPVTI